MKAIKFSLGLGSVVAILALLYFFPWKNITWGKVVMSPERIVTVTGYAESQEQNQIAEFSAGVSSIKDNKDEAVKEVNDKINAITIAVKEFGVSSDDIQTQSMSVYQGQETYYDNGVQKSRPGQWNVNNTIVITLRDTAKANGLTDLLTKSGATNVYGPNFQLDTSKKAEDSLMAAAIADARVKAEAMAKASDTSLNKVISVTEGSSGSTAYPLLYAKADGMGGGASLEAGTSKISKTVTVVWSLK